MNYSTAESVYHTIGVMSHDFLGSYHPQSLFESSYRYLTDNYTEFQLCVYGSLIVQTMAYFITSIPSFVFQFLPFMQRFKIQTARQPTFWDQINCLKLVFFSHSCIFVPLMTALFYATRAWNIPLDFESMPAWYTFLPKLLFCLIVEDTWHYFAHRALHYPPLYGRIHKIHHTYTSPFALTAEYAHPIETLVLGMGFFVPLPFICNHLMVFWTWLFVRSMQACDAHSGYDFPYLNPLNLLPFYGGAPFHDFHHKNFIGNYASSFTYWDRLLGTDSDWKKFQKVSGEKQQGKKSQ